MYLLLDHTLTSTDSARVAMLWSSFLSRRISHVFS